MRGRKKASYALAFALVMLMLTVCASALASGMDDASELMTLWGEDGYPDDVGGVYFDSVTGECGVLITVDDAARREEILSLVFDRESLVFTQCVYSFNEMNAVNSAIIFEFLSTGNEVYSTGVGWSVADDVTGYGESGKEFRVVVEVMPDFYDKYVSLFSERYGDMVKVERFSGAYATELAEDGGIMREYTPGELWFYGIFIGLCVMFIVLILIWQKNKKKREAE